MVHEAQTGEGRGGCQGLFRCLLCPSSSSLQSGYTVRSSYRRPNGSPAQSAGVKSLGQNEAVAACRSLIPKTHMKTRFRMYSDSSGDREGSEGRMGSRSGGGQSHRRLRPRRQQQRCPAVAPWKDVVARPANVSQIGLSASQRG